jgi:uncharacterized protein
MTWFSATRVMTRRRAGLIMEPLPMVSPRRADVADYHPLYLRGIEYFNRQEYFQSHEVWEALWGTEEGQARDFYKGLIQAAVALHHLARGNEIGAQRLLERCRQCLARYRPKYLGLDLEVLLAQIDRCVAGMKGRTDCRGDRLLADAPTISLQ